MTCSNTYTKIAKHFTNTTCQTKHSDIANEWMMIMMNYSFTPDNPPGLAILNFHTIFA